MRNKKSYFDIHLCGRCKFYRGYSCVLHDGGRASCKVRKCPTFESNIKYNVKLRRKQNEYERSEG